jgi:hypothetical protein
VGVPVCLPRELRRPTLVRAADWWAKDLLLGRVALLAGGNRSFVALGHLHGSRVAATSPFCTV